MDKNSISESLNHNINVIDRKNVVITGVKKLNSFDESEFFVESVMGQMIIKGDNLELLKLDTYQGSLSIKGFISSIIYLDGAGKKNKTDTVFARLFK